MARILELADAAGAPSVTPIALHLRQGVRAVFMDWLEAQRPDLVERYAELYGRGSYAPLQERRRLVGLVRPSNGRGGAKRFAGHRLPPAAQRTASAADASRAAGPAGEPVLSRR